jgi:hypothetical protein
MIYTSTLTLSTTAKPEERNASTASQNRLQEAIERVFPILSAGYRLVGTSVLIYKDLLLVDSKSIQLGGRYLHIGRFLHPFKVVFRGDGFGSDFSVIHVQSSSFPSSSILTEVFGSNLTRIGFMENEKTNRLEKYLEPVKNLQRSHNFDFISENESTLVPVFSINTGSFIGMHNDKRDFISFGRVIAILNRILAGDEGLPQNGALLTQSLDVDKLGKKNILSSPIKLKSTPEEVTRNVFTLTLSNKSINIGQIACHVIFSSKERSNGRYLGVQFELAGAQFDKKVMTYDFISLPKSLITSANEKMIYKALVDAFRDVSKNNFTDLVDSFSITYQNATITLKKRG